ncbi:MAG: VWA domain-containing protein [Planctomycetota bacterium]|nr:VWA domain-containing protein [Planctomycetota bacterium]
MLIVIGILIWALFMEGGGDGGSGSGTGGGRGTGSGAGVGDGTGTGLVGNGPGSGSLGSGVGGDGDTGNDKTLAGNPDGVMNAVVQAGGTPPAPPEQIAGRVAPRIGHSLPDAVAVVPNPVIAPPAAFGSTPNATPGQGASGRSGGGGGGTPVEFMGLKSEGKDFAFILDCSGSMAMDERFFHLTMELRKTLSGLTKENSFQIVFFDHGHYVMPPAKMVTATQAEKDAALLWVDQQFHGGATTPNAAIQYVLTQLKCDSIFLMTDGIFDDPPSVVALFETLNVDREVSVNTIAMHERGGEAILQQIAKENRGDYRFVPPPGALNP